MTTDGGDDQKKAYGTFQGQYQPSIGFPTPVPPPGLSSTSSGTPSPYYPPPHAGYPPPHAAGYQAVQGYAVVEGRPVRERRLPCCCGIGMGWCLFFLGFFIAAIPWYIGACIIALGRVDHREKPGYVACTIGAVLATIAAICGLTKGIDDW